LARDAALAVGGALALALSVACALVGAARGAVDRLRGA
jgi:hypothetical protein